MLLDYIPIIFLLAHCFLLLITQPKIRDQFYQVLLLFILFYFIVL